MLLQLQNDITDSGVVGHKPECFLRPCSMSLETMLRLEFVRLRGKNFNELNFVELGKWPATQQDKFLLPPSLDFVFHTWQDGVRQEETFNVSHEHLMGGETAVAASAIKGK